MVLILVFSISKAHTPYLLGAQVLAPTMSWKNRATLNKIVSRKMEMYEKLVRS
jgi:hypothetical protein